MKDWTEFIKFLREESNLLVVATIAIVGVAVFGLVRFDLLSIERPYIYVAYLIGVSGFACLIYLGLLGARVAWSGGKRWVVSGREKRRADERALRNLEQINAAMASDLLWIVRENGKRFSSSRWNALEELVRHGFLMHDDEETRRTDMTYYSVRDSIWQEISKDDFNWPKGTRVSSGGKPPWIQRGHY